MRPLRPLPFPTQPLVTVLPPSQPYGEYFRSIDDALRALIAPIPSVAIVNRVLALSDLAGTVEMNLAGANTLTIPPNASVPLPIGQAIKISQIGAGQTTLTPGAGVTIRSRVGLKLAGQYAVASIYKRGTDEWVASGDLTP